MYLTRREVLTTILSLGLLGTSSSHASAIHGRSQQLACHSISTDDLSIRLNFSFKRWVVLSTAAEGDVTNELQLEVEESLRIRQLVMCRGSGDYTSDEWIACQSKDESESATVPFVGLSYRFNRVTKLLDLSLTLECFEHSKNST